MTQERQTIYVAGHRGMVGSAIVRTLLASGVPEQDIIRRTHAELDLRNQSAAQAFFQQQRPAQVYLAAAKVGGIHAQLSQKRQCVLASVVRATVYAQRKPQSPGEGHEVLKRLIDEEYTRHPFYCSSKMVVYLQRCGHRVNRKRAQRLVRSMSLAGMAPGPNTSWAHSQHKVYPYLLRGVPVVHVNQVWSTDITYIRLASGFAYSVAIMDWYCVTGSRPPLRPWADSHQSSGWPWLHNVSTSATLAKGEDYPTIRC